MSSFRLIARIVVQAWRMLVTTQLNPKVLGIFHLEVLHFVPKHYQMQMQKLLLQAKCGVEVYIYLSFKLKDALCFNFLYRTPKRKEPSNVCSAEPNMILAQV